MAVSEFRSVATWPPAANWYCGNILAVSRTGWLCWGAKCGLVLARHNEDQYPTVITAGDAHNDKVKVTAVAWCPEEGGGGRERAELVSAAEDGVARVWRLEADQMRVVLVGEAGTESGRVTCVSWSQADPSLVMMGGETASSVTVWDLMTNNTRTITVGKQSVFSVASHPTQADLVAVGCKLGHLMLVNTQGTGRILSRLRGHEEDVYSLAWSPATNIKIGDTQHEEWLLASSSRDRTVRVWGERESRSVITLRLPQDKRKSDHSWISLCWSSSTTLLSAGAGGELLRWKLDVPGRKGGLEYRVLSREHGRNLFSICAHQDKVYTVGQERLVSVTSLSAEEKLYNLPCFAGFVYCLVSNPIEPGVLAVGGGDGAVRVWRSGDTTDMFSVRLVSFRQSKVMSLAWHPTREGLLAAGTDDGKVAWVEVVTSSRQPSVSSYQHRSGVYCLAWLASKSVISCGDGKIVQHDISSGKGQELNLGSSQGKSQVVIADRGDFQLLLVGYEDGSIQVYLHPSLSLLVNIKSQSKLIQSLALHPQHLSDGTQAEFSQYLASASNEFPVHIFDLTQIVKGAGEVEGEKEVLTEVLVTPTISLTGHLQRVIELAWAPHDSRLLCSVSYDWSAQVWDVSSGAALHNFSGHSGRVMTCLWHPTLPGLVITGSEDNTLHIWDPKDQPRQLPIERKKERKTKINKEMGTKDSTSGVAVAGKQKDSKDLTFDELLALHKSERTKSAEKSPVPEERKENVESAERGRHFLEARRDKRAKTTMKKLYFPVSSQTEAKRKAHTAEDCLNVYQHYQQNIAEGKDKPVSNGIKDSSSIDQNNESHLGFFTSREAMRRLLEAEVGVQTEDPEARAVLSLWSGDLETVVEEAIRTGTVTERLLSLSAGVSQRLWRRAAASAGEQCVREGEIQRGAEYLLSAGQVLEAVTVLSKNGHHRPAVAIARSRLPLESEVVVEVMRRWASQCQSDGNYSLAAKCWLSLGEAGEASEVLAKLSSSTGDQDCLRLAARLAPEEEKANIYRRQCLAQCLERSDQDLALQLIQDDHDNLLWCLPLFVTLGQLHRILTQAKEGTESGALLQNIRSRCDTLGYDWSSDNRQLITNFIRTTTVRDPRNQSLVQAAHLLVSALFTAQSEPQSCLGSVASCLHLLSSSHLVTTQLLTEMFPGGVAGGPPVGLAVLGRELDWQCNWQQLRSILASHAAITINTWAHSDTNIEQSDLLDVADAVMLDDVIKRQKLSAEIEEGEDAVAKFFVANIETTSESEADKTEKEESPPTETSNVDLTPSLRGTQTLSLTEDGKWKSEGVSDSVPLSGTEDNPPPPPPPSRSFHDRFLLGRSSNNDALKEIQKLKWTRDRTTATIEDIPFPDLTEVCKKFLLMMVEKDIGAEKTQSETEDDNVYKLSLRKKVARWGYYHGKRCYQEFFIKHS